MGGVVDEHRLAVVLHSPIISTVSPFHSIFKMMFKKAAAVFTSLVGMSSVLVGVAALPTNITEAGVAARSIDPSGTHTGQVCGRAAHR